jgi:hypothetical protein
VLPATYPDSPPFVYIDAPENPEVVEFIDYLDKGNRIMFDYLIHWDKEANVNVGTYNLTNLLTKCFHLFE